MIVALLLVLSIALLLWVASADAHWKPGIHNTRHAVNLAFCGRSNSYCAYAAQAWAVSACESRHSVYAVNGQYFGLFQFGAWARSRYGFGWNPWAQASAAARYWRAAGWAPWECRP